MADPWHLLAVDGGANMAKGDRDPAEWLPDNVSFRCTYVEHRVEIKRHWKLSKDQAEADAIRADLAACRAESLGGRRGRARAYPH